MAIGNLSAQRNELLMCLLSLHMIDKPTNKYDVIAAVRAERINTVNTYSIVACLKA